MPNPSTRNSSAIGSTPDGNVSCGKSSGLWRRERYFVTFFNAKGEKEFYTGAVVKSLGT